jgi:hypothetical protein
VRRRRGLLKFEIPVDDDVAIDVWGIGADVNWKLRAGNVGSEGITLRLMKENVAAVVAGAAVLVIEWGSIESNADEVLAN